MICSRAYHIHPTIFSLQDLSKNEDNCNCRKPKTGSFHKAVEELGIKTLEGKFFVGDSQRDMQAGREVGLKTVLVLSGKSSKEDAESWEYKPDFVCRDFAEVVELILK